MNSRRGGVPIRNPSGALDPTAHAALVNIRREQGWDMDKQRQMELIRTLRYIIDNAGFDLMNRIELRDRKTGKHYF